jgi:hypothetical protein
MDPTHTSIHINLADLPSPYETLKKLSLATELELDMGNAFSAMSLQNRVQFASSELLKKYEHNRTFWDGVLDFLKSIFCVTPEYDKVLEFCKTIKAKENTYTAPVDPNVEADKLIKYSDDDLIDAFKMVPESRKTLVAFSLADKLLRDDRLKEAATLLRAYPSKMQYSELGRLEAEEASIIENYKKNKGKIEGSVARRHRITDLLVQHYLKANDETSASMIKYHTGIHSRDAQDLISKYQRKYIDIIDALPLDQIADKVKDMSEDAKRHAVNRALDLVKNNDDIKEAYKILMLVSSEDVQKTFITAFLLGCQRYKEYSIPDKIYAKWSEHFSEDQHKIFRAIATNLTAIYLNYIPTHPLSRSEAREYANLILEECPDLAHNILNKICAFEVDLDLLVRLSAYYGYDIYTIREYYVEAQIAYAADNPSEKDKVFQRIEAANNIDLSNYFKHAPTNPNRGKPTFYNA